MCLTNFQYVIGFFVFGVGGRAGLDSANTGSSANPRSSAVSFPSSTRSAGDHGALNRAGGWPGLRPGEAHQQLVLFRRLGVVGGLVLPLPDLVHPRAPLALGTRLRQEPRRKIALRLFRIRLS